MNGRNCDVWGWIFRRRIENRVYVHSNGNLAFSFSLFAFRISVFWKTFLLALNVFFFSSCIRPRCFFALKSLLAAIVALLLILLLLLLLWRAQSVQTPSLLILWFMTQERGKWGGGKNGYSCRPSVKKPSAWRRSFDGQADNALKHGEKDGFWWPLLDERINGWIVNG